MTVAGNSRPIRGRATFTTVPSRNTIEEPRTTATIVQRCLGFIGAWSPEQASCTRPIRREQGAAPAFGLAR